ncbi:hypothetical protein OIDMADRAFT_181879 [Oidiodendron maius Zn]|uniref:Uncharacterized protein n=1 Tax=Oidiodendron maius (strain Zn) TaxID=913774 RepID=A0A0C3D9G1_OIDMZ|nr:hypothetical protein OIDMADRAFT_181879 [Oidiodendron maius Zn]
MSNLSKSWALNQTATDTISVATGVLAAATSDNVQALAIMACEGLGATLPMTTETCLKVNKLCTQDHQGAVLSFLKATIGYKKGDCAWQLAQSDAGVRFLGLAAAFLTLGTWEAAASMHTLIRDTAENQKLVPTATQLKQVIESLDYKLSLASFAETAFGWSILVSRGQGTKSGVPSQKLIVNLVQALSAVSRIGDSDSRKIEVTVPLAESAWVIAFIKWSVGTPNVVADSEEIIKGEGDAVVTVRISQAGAEISRPQIVVLNEVGEIKHLIKDLPGGLGSFGGMISLRLFGTLLMQERFGGHESLAFRACVEALPLACLRALSFIRLKHYLGKDVTTFSRNYEISLDSCDPTWTSIFPSKSRILSVLASFLGVDNIPEPDSDTVGVLLVHDLPLVHTYQKVLRKDCPCIKCQKTSSIRRRNCSFDKFSMDVSACASVVLLVSLIHSTHPDGPKLYYGSGLSCNDFSAAQVIKETAFKAFNITKDSIFLKHLINDTLRLLGHDTDHSQGLHSDWVMSSYKGQTLFPKLLSTRCVEIEGVISIMCVSGAIWLGDEKYELVQSSAVMQASIPFDPSSVNSLDGLDLDEEESLPEQPTLAKIEMDSPSNAYPDFRLIWQVRARERKLHVNLACPDFPSMPQRSPVMAIYSAAESLVVNCGHDKYSKLSGSTRGLQATSPAQPVPSMTYPDGTVGIIQSNGNEAMRFFSLAAGQRGIIRGDACLQCCVLCSRITGINFIIC